MDPKLGRFFVWDRKEIFVLFLLAGVVALFSFTLGLHLGKRVHNGPISALPHDGAPEDAPLIDTQEDQAPSRADLQGLESDTESESEEILDESLRDEVSKTGIHLDDSRQVELPKDKKAPEAAKVVGHAAAPAPAQPVVSAGKLTLQIGSFPTAEAAAETLKSLRARSLAPELAEVEVRDVGKRFRVLVGRFEKKDQAEAAGLALQKKGWIGSYLITRFPEGKH